MIKQNRQFPPSEGKLQQRRGTRSPMKMQATAGMVYANDSAAPTRVQPYTLMPGADDTALPPRKNEVQSLSQTSQHAPLPDQMSAHPTAGPTSPRPGL